MARYRPKNTTNDLEAVQYTNTASMAPLKAMGKVGGVFTEDQGARVWLNLPNSRDGFFVSPGQWVVEKGPTFRVYDASDFNAEYEVAP
jgi:hypothetical protein